LRAGGSFAEVVPERGGLVTRFDDVLYLDEATLVDPAKSVRGGVPILFPCAGKADGLPYPLRGQHGFARQMPFRVRDVGECSVSMDLLATAETRAVFPFEFFIRLDVLLAPDDLTLSFEIANNGDGMMPVHFGLHPYFQVPLAAKGGFAVDAPGVSGAFDNTRGVEVPYAPPDFAGGEVDLHFPFAQGGTVMRAPGRRPVRLSWSEGFGAMILWTQPGKEFVCVEPWSALTGELRNPRRLLAPGGSVAFTFRMTVE
jgi:galactose mutarotase-like enzyme